MRTILFIVIILVSSLCGQYYQNLHFERIGTRQGLNQNTITSIIQDHRGYLWFGTQNGINRYDGYTFISYNDLVNNTNSYASTHVTSIADDGNNHIWIGTTNLGVSIFDLKTGKFHILDMDENSKSIKSIIRDKDNFIWIGSENSGLYKYSTKFKQIEHFSHNTIDNSTLSSDKITAIFEDKNGLIYIGTHDAGLNCLDPYTSKIKRIKLPNKHLNITDINQDSDGIIWIGSGLNGLLLLHPGSGYTSSYRHNPKNRNSLAHNTVSKIYRDSKDHIWVGTDDGLSLFIPEEHTFYNYRNNPQDLSTLSSDQIASIFEDSTGIMWFGTYSTGLCRFTKQHTIFTNYTQNQQDKIGLNSNEIWSIVETDTGIVWLGTAKGLTKWDTREEKFIHFEHSSSGNSISHSVVRAVHPLRNGKLLLGTNGGGINVFDPRTNIFTYYKSNQDSNSLSDNRIRDFESNGDGTVWVATMGGLNLFDPKTGHFKSFSHKENDPNSLQDNRILDLKIDHNGKLWIATYNGLSMYDPKKDKFLNFLHDESNPNSISNNDVIHIFESKKEKNILWIATFAGLNKLNTLQFKFTNYLQKESVPNNVIYSVVEDDQDYLWLGTSKGLSRFNKRTKEFKNFGQNDGIKNDEYNAGSTCKLSNGNLLFGGVSGITALMPSEIEANTRIPNIEITAFRKYDTLFSIDSLLAENSTLILDYTDKYISFEFAALDFTNPQKNQYQFMLEGFDTEWNKITNRRFASYTNLDGGNYIFKVKGSNNDGVWNESGAQIKIYITPPFWETIWFQIIAFLVVSLVVLSFYRQRMARIRKQQEILQKTVTERTKELYKRNLELKKAQKEKDSILKNVEEGFFLIDEHFIIQSQFSAALLNILETDSVSGKSFIEIINSFFPEKQSQLTKEYIELLFDDQLDEELICDLNPLNKQEFVFYKKNTTKYLTFRFKRIITRTKITGLITTVIDETEEYLLSKALKDTEAKSKKQIEWLMGILHLDSKLLYEFMESSYSELRGIHKRMQNDPDEKEFKNILGEISRSLHLLKGNANLLDLTFFAQQVHEIEDVAVSLKEQEEITGSDFLPLVMRLNELGNNLDELNNLIDRLEKFNVIKADKTDFTDESLINSIAHLIERVSKDQDKQVRFNHAGFKSELIPPQYKLLVKNTLIQMVKNSLAHGIESAEERHAQLKPVQGTISVLTVITEKNFIIQYKDDGRGLQLGKLKQKALDSNIWNKNEIQSWDKSQLTHVIFTPGISSAEKTDHLSGRGVGMDLIMDQLQKYNGKIEVDSIETEYCKFTIMLPLINEN